MKSRIFVRHNLVAKSAHQVIIYLLINFHFSYEILNVPSEKIKFCSNFLNFFSRNHFLQGASFFIGEGVCFSFVGLVGALFLIGGGGLLPPPFLPPRSH